MPKKDAYTADINQPVGENAFNRRQVSGTTEEQVFANAIAAAQSISLLQAKATIPPFLSADTYISHVFIYKNGDLQKNYDCTTVIAPLAGNAWNGIINGPAQTPKTQCRERSVTK